MICPRCGASATPADRFCSVCASPLSPSAPAGPPPPPYIEAARVTVTDHAVSRRFDDVVLGRAFAFFGKSAFQKPGFS